MRRIRLSKKSPYAKCAVYYAVDKDPKTKKDRPCVFLECTRSGRRLGPCWGQDRRSVERALSRMNLACDCPCRAHRGSMFFGQRTVDLAPDRASGAQ